MIEGGSFEQSVEYAHGKFMVVDGFNTHGFDSKKYTLIVPSKAEFTMRNELEPYFKVVRK